jgi:hypothetical protein
MEKTMICFSSASEDILPSARTTGRGVVQSSHMHNGALGTLEEVIDFYDRGGGDDPKKSPMLRPLGLSREDKGVSPGIPRHRAFGKNAGIAPARPPLNAPAPVVGGGGSARRFTAGGIRGK